MTKLDAIKQSPASILANAKKSRKQYDKMWNAAARAPVFCKITKKTLDDGKARRYTFEPTLPFPATHAACLKSNREQNSDEQKPQMQ